MVFDHYGSWGWPRVQLTWLGCSARCLSSEELSLCVLRPRRPAAEFGVEIGEYQGVVRVPRRVFQRILPERPTPEQCVEAYYLQRTRFEHIAERKVRWRQLTKEGKSRSAGAIFGSAGSAGTWR
jgi:hypothetical protein